MRLRLPLILVCLMVSAALIAAGCGKNTTVNGQTINPTGGGSSVQTSAAGDAATKDSTSSGNTSGQTATTSDTADAAAKETLLNCYAAANKLSNTDDQFNAKKRCKQVYENIKNATKDVKSATAQAHANCVQAANSIANADAKSSALAACDKIK